MDAPKCAEGPLPEWVRQADEPDQDTNAAAIRLCYEHGSLDTLTMRMANNRTFSQYVYTKGGDNHYNGYWLSGAQASLVWLAQLAAHRELSDSTERVLIPPLKQVSAGVPRPSTSGPHAITSGAVTTPARS